MWHRSVGRPRLVAVLVVFMLGMMGGTASTVVVSDTETFSQHLIAATTLATARLESLKAMGLPRLPSTHTIWLEDYHTIAGFPTFRRQTVVEPCAPDVGMATVTVTVWWDGSANTVRLSLIVAE